MASDLSVEEKLVNLIKLITPKDNKLKDIAQLFDSGSSIDFSTANSYVERRTGEDEDDVELEIEDTCLSLAIKKGSQEVVDFLLEKGADVAITFSTGNTIFHFLAETQNDKNLRATLVKIKDLLSREESEFPYSAEQYIEVLNRKNNQQETAVQIGLRLNNSVICDLLLKEGAVFNFDEPVDESGLLLIHKRAITGDIKGIECLLNLGVRVDVKDKSPLEQTIFHHAAIQDKKDVFEMLAKRLGKIEPDMLHQEDTEGNCVIECCVNNGRTELLKLLTTKLGANLYHLNSKDGLTVLHRAVVQKRKDVMEDLLSTFKFRIAEVDSQGNTCLHHSSVVDSIEICQSLIDKKLDHNLKNNNGDTPLHIAAGVSCKPIIELFLNQKKTDIVENNFKQTPLFIAIKKKRDLEIIKLLYSKDNTQLEKEDSSNQSPLQLALNREYSEVALYLIEQGANVSRPYVGDECDKGYVTLVNQVIDLQFVDVLKAILENTTEAVNTCDNNGRCPLHNAILLQNLDMVRSLTRKRCSIESKEGNSGLSPLMLACNVSNEPIVEFLLRKCRASVTAVDLNGKTPLHHAAGQNSGKIVGLLIQNKAQVNALDLQQLSPLHEACAKNNSESVTALLKHGADLTLKDSQGMTPLHCAVMHSSLECCILLLEHGASVYSKDDEGRTPIFVAAQVGAVECGKACVQFEAKKKKEIV